MKGEVKQDSNALVWHLILRGIENEDLRDEIFCQIMRQITLNPSQDAVQRGWELMMFCSSCFAPSKFLNKVSLLFFYCTCQGVKDLLCTILPLSVLAILIGNHVSGLQLDVFRLSTLPFNFNFFKTARQMDVKLAVTAVSRATVEIQALPTLP